MTCLRATRHTSSSLLKYHTLYLLTQILTPIDADIPRSSSPVLRGFYRDFQTLFQAPNSLDSYMTPKTKSRLLSRDLISYRVRHKTSASDDADQRPFWPFPDSTGAEVKLRALSPRRDENLGLTSMHHHMHGEPRRATTSTCEAARSRVLQRHHI